MLGMMSKAPSPPEGLLCRRECIYFLQVALILLTFHPPREGESNCWGKKLDLLTSDKVNDFPGCGGGVGAGNLHT